MLRGPAFGFNGALIMNRQNQKILRQNTIIGLLMSGLPFRGQGELICALFDAGFTSITQASVSRDLKTLGAFKRPVIRTADFVYELPLEVKTAMEDFSVEIDNLEKRITRLETAFAIHGHVNMESQS
jgi:arginine repressor